jgi:pimeloyl-ACP methyl ester carboxylesterase
MTDAIEMLTVGTGTDQRPIAVSRRAGTAPGLFWLNGFRSTMSGAKALAVDALGAERGLAVTRFDYSGHGLSGGRFEDGTITRWLDEALAVFETTSGPQLVIGSSLGGWLALLLARRIIAENRHRISALVLIAPAVDSTQELREARFSDAERALLDQQSYLDLPSRYGDGPYRYTKALIEDGRRHRLFGTVIETGCPVTILQGGQDPDVPQSHAIRLVTHLLHDPVTLTLIPDGDHRLSRPQDLERLRAAITAYLDTDAEG